MRAKFDSAEEQVRKMLTQLRYLGKVRWDGDYVMLPGRKADHDIITAFDVITDLTSGQAEGIRSGDYPFTLIFSAGVEMRTEIFGVIIVDRYAEQDILAGLKGISPDLTVIFVISRREQQKYLKVNNKSYFAIRENSGYRFYRPTGKML
jgi:hypothetical protein